jgi:hypothetical protein
MAAVSRHKVWSVVFSGIALVLVACIGSYFVAVRTGGSVRSAATWVAIILVVTLIPVGVVLAQVIREPGRNPLTPSTGVVFWMVTGAVVPILASVLNLGMGVLVVAMLTGLEAVGLPGSDIQIASWVTSGVSLLSAVGIWWFIWKRYRPN